MTASRARRTRPRDLIGRRFGHWLVTAAHSEQKRVTCVCDCGVRRGVRASALVAGRTRSCGCSSGRVPTWNMTGQRFGRLVVVAHAGQRANLEHTWSCRCDCGGIKVVTTNHLRSGHVISCGCAHAEFIDLRGHRFGRLVALESTRAADGSHAWRCRCDCGRVVIRTSGNLRPNSSCGCALVEHGHARGSSPTPEYRAWVGMIQRCTNPNRDNYARYGGRGIRVCVQWLESFDEFFRCVGPRPSSRHTIDRIDNDGNYEPGNVRWATNEEQHRNKRGAILFTHDGRTMCLSEWIRELKVPVRKTYWRVARGWPIARALGLSGPAGVSKTPQVRGDS